tara:strand:+ start:111 stop:323 length:213 start_codon:yes stop_codon:yes gene_type:complete
MEGILKLNKHQKRIMWASYMLRLNNSHFISKDINDLLNIDVNDRNQTHASHYGIWMANKKLGLTGGYKMK